MKFSKNIYQLTIDEVDGMMSTGGSISDKLSAVVMVVIRKKGLRWERNLKTVKVRVGCAT